MSYNPNNANGQATMANSAPIVIASNQTSVPTTIADSITGVKSNVSLLGQLQVKLDDLPIFNESYEGGTIDTTNRWNSPVLAGTGTVTQGSTLGLVLTVGTTANNGGALSSIPTFPTQYASAISWGGGLKIEATPIATGNYRFFGFGTSGTSYSTTNPIANGIGFEITTAGVLRAVVYASDVLVFSSNLTIPTDGLEHIYLITARGNFINWYYDNFIIPAATSIALNIFPDITLLPIRYASLNGGSTTVGTPAFTVFGTTVLDGSRPSSQLSDGIYPWRKATIDISGNLATSMPDLNVTGQATQTVTVNNILTTTSGTAATDLTGYRSASVQVVSTGTGGTFIFEGSNDNTNWIALPIFNQLILTGTPITAAITATSSQIIYSFPVTTRYVRLRIATTITGGSIQAFSKFMQISFAPAVSQIAQATAANLNITAALAAAQTLATVTTVSTVTSVTALAGGQTAHSSASTGAPVRIGGRVLPVTPDLTLVAGDASDLGMTTGQQAVIKDYAPAELDFTFNGLITNSTTASVFKNAAGASIRNYVTGIVVNSDTLTSATEIVIKDGAVSSTSVAANVLTSSAAHDYKIGDAVVFSAVGSYTGIVVGTIYYVLTVPSTTTYTLSATANGSTATVTGTGTATSNRLLFRSKLQTTSFGPASFIFPSPLRGMPNGTMDFQTVTATIGGGVYYNVQGYIGF